MPKRRTDGEPLIPVLAMKGVPAWRAWLEDFANARGSSSAETVEAALKALAELEGFRLPPDRT